jgi:hypothetical protein
VVGYTSPPEMSVYLLRSRNGLLGTTAAQVVDTLFSNERFDHQKLAGAQFDHCTFANVSFLDAELRDCRFNNCVFEGCYFRGTKIVRCHFPASRFIDCEFPKPRIFATGFQHTRFTRSVPDFAVLEPNLPGEPNLCRDLCAALAVEARNLGREKEARQYRLREIREHEEALRRGYRWSDDYSRDHYPELQRVTAFLALAGSRLNGWVWGHGEYAMRLLLNLMAIALVVGPVALFVARDHLHDADSVGFGDCVGLSVASVFNSAGSAGVSASGVAFAIVLVLTGLGLLFLGLFVTYVFRAVTRR